jgi:hypothetical protein
MPQIIHPKTADIAVMVARDGFGQNYTPTVPLKLTLFRQAATIVR